MSCASFANTDAKNPSGGGSFFVRTDFRADQPPNKQGDGPQVVVESDSFLIPDSGMLTMQAASNGGMLDILDADTDAVLATINPALTSTTLAEYSADLSAFAGTEAYMRLTDNSSGGWGHVTFDHIAISGYLAASQVPESATLGIWAMLAAGLSATRRLRRRATAGSAV